jgi:hypothetical protein
VRDKVSLNGLQNTKIILCILFIAQQIGVDIIEANTAVHIFSFLLITNAVKDISSLKCVTIIRQVVMTAGRCVYHRVLPRGERCG